VLVVVPRLSAALGWPPLGAVWQNTAVAAPNGWARWRDALTGAEWKADRSMLVAELFRILPIAVLMGE
jgi:maltooligosyltrehalose synthase